MPKSKQEKKNEMKKSRQRCIGYSERVTVTSVDN